MYLFIQTIRRDFSTRFEIGKAMKRERICGFCQQRMNGHWIPVDISLDSPLLMFVIFQCAFYVTSSVP